jgi:hypothetical protein
MPESASLPAPALARLHAGVPVLVLSADAGGAPHSTYSWAVALDAQRLRFGVDRGSTTSANLLASASGAIVVVGSGGLNLLIGGRVRRLRARIDAVEPIPLELWEIEVTRVKDQSWPGVTTSALRYRAVADGAPLRRLEKGIYAALRTAAPAAAGSH